jgi:hypothetical protein
MSLINHYKSRSSKVRKRWKLCGGSEYKLPRHNTNKPLQLLYCHGTTAAKRRGSAPCGLRRSWRSLNNRVNRDTLKVLARLCRSVGNALALTPIPPRQLEPPALIELVVGSCETDTGWLLKEATLWPSLLNLAWRKETASSSLLARMNTPTAGRL